MDRNRSVRIGSDPSRTFDLFPVCRQQNQASSDWWTQNDAPPKPSEGDPQCQTSGSGSDPLQLQLCVQDEVRNPN